MIFSRASHVALQSCIASLAVIAVFVPPVGVRAQGASSAGDSVVLNPDPLSRVVGLPPAPESAAAREDLAILLWLQNARTPEMEANAWLLLERNLGSFSRALGVDMAKSTPHINAALKRDRKSVV